ncbi:hypothetical protein WA158_006745 [Blastocystis sp. Blastoise]
MKVGIALSQNFTELANFCDVETDASGPEYRLVIKKDHRCYSNIERINFMDWLHSKTYLTQQPSYIQVLTDSNFDSIKNSSQEKEKYFFVLFYVPWQTRCHDISITYERIAKVLKGTSSIIMGKIDCQGNPEICSRYHTEAFPSFQFYYSNGTLCRDRVPMTQYGYGILSFINDHIQTYYTIDGTLNHKYGRVHELDTLSNKKDKELYRKQIISKKNIYKQTAIYFKYIKEIEKKNSLEDIKTQLETQLEKGKDDIHYMNNMMKYNILNEFIPLQTKGFINMSAGLLHRYIQERYPILLLFHTSWCVKCTETYDAMKKVSEVGYKNTIIAEIDGDLYPELIDMMGILGYPSLLSTEHTYEAIYNYIKTHVDNPMLNDSPYGELSHTNINEEL